MLHKPCVQVVMRFRPNPGVASPFYSTDDTGAPWLTYDERTVRVVERDPPMDRKRVEPNGGPCGDSNDPPVSKALVPAPVTSYTFDAVLSDTSTQRDVHKCIGEPVIGNVLKGYNATIFSYGQTGSGKTYTMLGPYGGLADAFFEDSPFYGERGLVPRVVEELFNRLNTMKSEEYTWRVKTQMFEIYRENIVDLLIEGDQQPQTEYRIREGKNSQGSFCMYVDSLKEVECRTAADFMDILQRGVASRHTRETGTNDRSSRSHCLLCLFVELKHNEDYSMWTESRLNFVDLAGSERVATSQAEGETLKETQYINLSLSLLGNVIHRLAGGNTGHIPYRDTKLTRVLKDSLGGNSLTTLLCHGTTEAATKSQTINTLRFAQKALRIKTRAVVNKPSKTTIKQQQQEFYKEHTKQLEKQIRVLQEIIRSRENTEGENSMCTKCESMSAAIASLTKEIERLQKELIAREEQLQQTQETGDYYKKNCETLENELAKLTEEQEANDARHIEAYTILEEESENLRAEIEALQKQLAEKPHKDASNSEALSNKNNTRKNNYNDYKNRATMTDRRTHSNCCTMTDPVAIVMTDVMEDMQRRLTKELINCGTMTDIRSHSNCCTMTDPVAIVMPDVMEDMQRRLTKELINCGTMTDGTISTNRATMTDRRTHSNCCTMTDPVAIVMPDVMEDMQRRLTKELINCGTMTDIRSHSNCCTMTDPVAIVMPDVMEDMQRRLTKELINCGTMTDGTISTNRATMTDRRTHSNCCTMTDPVAIVMPDVMEDMQRRLTKELINCGTMTDIRSHSNCCTMTDPVAIVMPDVMEDMQRRLTKELINCGTMTYGTISTNRATMTDRRTHSNCCTMTDPVAIVMPDVMEDMQRRLTKELINCGTMTDIRSHSNCCTMTDPVAIVMPDVMEDMQRRLTKELINCGTMTDGTISTNRTTMTDRRTHSNCCTMTDPVAIVMPDVMEDMQRRLTKELINCGTMTDIRSHSNCCTMTDPVAIVMPDVMEDMQRRLTKELINCGTMTDGTISTNRATMTDRRTHSNCCTMTDPVAIVMPDVMEDMQRRLTKELINCGTMTDIRSHSNCCTMTDPVAIVMPDVMEDMQRRLTKELINCGTMTDGTISTNRATMTEVCRQTNSLDRRVSCVSGTAENVSLSGETFCRNTSVNTRECSYIARNTIFASSVVSSFVPVIGEGQFEWWCLDDVYAHALLFSYCNPRDVGINIGLFDDCDDKVLLQSLGVVHRTLGSIRADYDGSVVSVIRRFLVQQRGALAGDGALEGCVPCEALFEVLISARNALLVEPMVSDSSTVKGEDRVCHGDGEGALDSCVYAHLQVAMTAVFSIARERGGYLSDIFASVKVQKALEAMRQFFTSSNLFSSGSSSVSSTSEANGDSSSFLEDMLRETEVPRFVLGGALQRAAAVLKDDVVTKLQRRRLCGGLSLEEALLACYLAEERITALTEIENLREEMVQPVTREALDLIDGAVRAFLKSEESEDFSAEATNHMKSSSFTTALAFLFTYVAAQTATETVGLPQDSTEHVRDALNVVAQTLLRRSVSQTSRFDVAQSNTAIDPESMQQSLRIIMDYAESQGYYPVTCDTSDACSRSNHHCQYSQQTRRKDTPDIDVTKREALMEKMDSPRTTPRSSPHPRLSSPQEQRPQTSVVVVSQPNVTSHHINDLVHSGRMTDPVAIVMPDVMEDMQRRLTKELINCGTMTDGTVSTNRATMTDRRTHSNCWTMTDPVAIVMPDVMEDMQRRLTKELINCGTMTDIRSHSNCCTMTDPVAIVMPDVMEDVQRRPSNRLDASTSLKVSENNGDVPVYEAVRFGDEKVVVDSCSVASVSDSFPRDLSSEVGKLQLRVLDLGKEVYMLQKELMAREEQLQKTQERADYYKKNCETLENELAKLTEEQERNDARRTEAYTILEEESENLRAEIEALQKQLAEKPHKDASNSEALSNKNNTRKTDSDHAVDGKENLGLHHVSSVRSLVHLRENKAREHLRSRSWSNGREPPGGVLPTGLRTWPQTAQQSAPAACTHEKGVERKLSEELDESDVVNHLTAQATPEMLNLKPELFVKNPASFDRLVSYLTRLVERAEREPGALSCEERHLSEVLKVFSTFYCGYRSIESGTGTCPIVDGNLRSRGGSSHSLLRRAKGMWSPESLRVSPDVGRNVDAVKEDQNGKHLGPVPSASTTFRTGRSERCTSSVRGVALVGGLLASRRRSSTAPSPTEGPRVPLPREEIEDLEGMSELVSSIEDMQSQLAYFSFSNEPELRESIKQLQQHLEELRAVLESQMSTTKMSQSPSYISSFRGSCFSQGNQQGQGVQEGKPPLKAESNGCQPATDSACDTNYSNGGQTDYLAVCNAVNTCCGGRGAFHRGSNRCSHWVPLRMHRANHDENVGLAMNEPGGSIPQGRSNAFDDGSQRKCMAPNRRNQSAVMRRLLDSMRFDLDSYVYTAAEQNAASAALLEESSSLKEREADMWLRLNQTEFCEMARIEMRLKRDDLRELQHEIHRMHLLHDKELVERKRRLLIYSYRKLLDFAKRMSDILKAREFCTGTLESQRLLLLDETSDFTKDVEKYIEVL